MKKRTTRLRRLVISRRVLPGFTLIEVMIVVAIIAILAAIAVPSYNDYVRRGTLPEAFNALSDFRSKMEQYYQDNRNYGTAAKCAADATAANWNNFAATKHFSFSCTASGAAFQSYVITATGSGTAAGHVYTINETGLRKTTKFKNATVDQECWLTTSAAC